MDPQRVVWTEPKGLNYCMTIKFNNAQFEIDLQKAVCKMNLQKDGLGKNANFDQYGVDKPDSIGPLGFSPHFSTSES